MSGEIVRQASAVAQRVESGAVGFRSIDPEVKEVLRNYLCEGATDAEIEVFIAHSRSRGLSVFNGQLWAIRRKMKVKEVVNGKAVERERWALVPQTGIAGLRLIAQRTGLYQGSTEPQYSDDGVTWSTVWSGAIAKNGAGAPAFCRVGVRRAGWPEPQFKTISFAEATAQSRYGGPGGDLMGKWQDIPLTMFGYAAERYALRMAFPEELADVEVVDVAPGPGSLADYAEQVAEEASTRPALTAPAPAPAAEEEWRTVWAGLWQTAADLGLSEDDLKAVLRDELGLSGASELTPAHRAQAVQALARVASQTEALEGEAEHPPEPSASEVSGSSSPSPGDRQGGGAAGGHAADPAEDPVGAAADAAIDARRARGETPESPEDAERRRQAELEHTRERLRQAELAARAREGEPGSGDDGPPPPLPGQQTMGGGVSS